MERRLEDLIRDGEGAMCQARGRRKNCYVFSDSGASDTPASEWRGYWNRPPVVHAPQAIFSVGSLCH